MSAPSLIAHVAQFVSFQGLPASHRVFEVQRTGVFGGRSFERGELLVVDGMARDGDDVVLTANGRGRPRLGRVSGRELLGDRGEPCSASRWSCAGRLLGVARRVGSGFGFESLEQPSVVRMMQGSAFDGSMDVEAPKVVQPAAGHQLSLFAA